MALMYTCIRMLFILMYVLFKSKNINSCNYWVYSWFHSWHVRTVLFVGPRGRIGNIYCILNCLGQVYAGTVFG